MHGLSSPQRLATFTLGHHHASAGGDCSAAQSPAAACAGSVSAESGACSGRLGHSGQSPRGRGKSLLRRASTGTTALVPAATSVATVAGAIVKLIVLVSIRFYQACLSPILPSACRYYPSCSAYAFEAVEKWGVRTGVRLALGRLLRCRPWGSHGYDPVPDREGVRS